jgi:hypothetical protein
MSHHKSPAEEGGETTNDSKNQQQEHMATLTSRNSHGISQFMLKPDATAVTQQRREAS